MIDQPRQFEAGKKREYQPSRLKLYGNLHQLTHNAGMVGAVADNPGGSNKTR